MKNKNYGQILNAKEYLKNNYDIGDPTSIYADDIVDADFAVRLFDEEEYCNAEEEARKEYYKDLNIDTRNEDDDKYDYWEENRSDYFDEDYHPTFISNEDQYIDSFNKLDYAEELLITLNFDHYDYNDRDALNNEFFIDKYNYEKELQRLIDMLVSRAHPELAIKTLQKVFNALDIIDVIL